MRAFASVTIALLALASPAVAQPFQLLVTVSPPGSISNPENWQDVLRYSLAADGAAAVPLDPIPASQLSDPAGIGFRTATDLFIGNRHGNVLGQGSISRFTVSADGLTITPSGNFTAPGMIGVHDLAFSPVTGELFAAAVNNGIFRFRFDASGNPVANGSFAAGVPMRGVAVHPSGRYVYSTSASNLIRVFRIETDDSVTSLPAVFPPGAQNLHFFAIHPDGAQLYVGDINVSTVYRYRMGSGGELAPLPSVSSPAAIDTAFSPDGLEMFVGNHFQGGITRFAFDSGADQWVQSGFISSPSMGAFAIYTPTATPCFADFNGDGNVDPDDLSDFITCFFLDVQTPGFCPASDFNADGFRDPDDLADFITAFFTAAC